MARIGVDAHVLDGKYQGSRTWLTQLLAALGPSGAAHQWIIYSADPARTAAQFPFPHFEHRGLPASGGSVRRLLLFWPVAERRDQLDALLTQYIAPPLLRGSSLVVIHDLLFESDPDFFPPLMRLRLKILCRFSARRADAILAVSRHAAGEIAKRYGIPPSRIHLAPNGRPEIIPAGPAELEWAAELQPYLLCVGRLEPRKNIGLALAASARARAQGVKLVVVGREDFRSSSLMNALSAAPNVVHLRDVAEPMLSALYARAAALVFPSLGEGFGIPIIEALAHGTAVIASGRSAIPEVGGTVTHYFDPLAPDAEGRLAALIELALEGRLAPDPKETERHLSQFSWEAAALALARVADALTNVRRPSRGGTAPGIG